MKDFCYLISLSLSFNGLEIIKNLYINLSTTNMKNRKLIGWSLLIVGLITGLGMILDSQPYWFVVDVIVILTCCGSGLYLLFQKSQS